MRTNLRAIPRLRPRAPSPRMVAPLRPSERLLADLRSATGVEYGLVAGGLVAVVATALTVLGGGPANALMVSLMLG